MTSSAEETELGAISCRVFHGTRLSAAAAIVEHGFRPRSVAGLVEAVANAHAVEIADVMEDLRRHQRFVVSDGDRQGVSVVATAEKALSWAGRSPEATWESLWAVYRLHHPKVGTDWLESNEGHLWVLAQQLDDPPALVAAEATLGSLIAYSFGQPKGSAAEIVANAVARGGDYERALSLRPEFRAAPGALTPRGYVEEAVQVDEHLLDFMVGDVELARQLRSELEWRPGTDGLPLFNLHQFWAALPESRRELLQELAGREIEPRQPAASTVAP